MISLNYRDSRPIYEQIRDGLRKLIVTGARAEVDAAIEENVRFFRDDLHYRVCPMSEQ